MPIQVVVVPHDPRWRDEFCAESSRVADALGPNVAAVHHIGSTAIPTIYAKPIIDLLVEVADVAAIDSCNSAMRALGYEPRGEFGIPGRRFFRKDDDRRVRTHHVHAFAAGCADVARHLAFRDFLLAHDDWAQRYSDLKRRLADDCDNDIERYMDGKDLFIKKVDALAAAWRCPRSRTEPGRNGPTV
jgi:GrpB-like predicted nucleotidyltransferase (UPF0157 family)